MAVEKENLVCCIEQDMTMKEAATYLGVSKSTIQRACKTWDLSFDKIGKVSQEYLDTITSEKIMNCLDRGLTMEQAATEFGISRTAFANRLSKLGLSFRKLKFDPEEYAYLKEQGLLDKEIMDIFGMSESGMRYAKDLHGIEKQKRNYSIVSQEELEKLYLTKKLSIKDISEQLGKSITNIYEMLKQFDIQLRREDGINISKETLQDLYIEKKESLAEIAKKKRTTEDAVKLAIIRHGLDSEILYSEKDSAPLNCFNPLQEQLIYGSLLGDASLGSSHINNNLKIEHCKEQEQYVNYKYQILRNFVQNFGIKEGKRFDKRTNKFYAYCKFKTVQRRIFSDIFPLFYYYVDKNKIKYVNEEVLEKLDERGLAFWFMDDGWKAGNRLGISTDSFSAEDLERIVRYFKEKWDIQTEIDKGNRILFKKQNAFLFQSLIYPHILPLFAYKLLDIAHQKMIKEREFKRDLKELEFDPRKLKISDFNFSHEYFSLEIKKFVEKYEWLGTIGVPPKWCFTARYQDKLGGVVLINEPNAYSQLLEKFDPRDYEALIQRGCSASWAPKNLGSSLIMFALKWMVKNTDKRVFVGYSDPKAQEIGIIYQACNFDYLGENFGAKYLYQHPSFKDGKKFSEQTLYRTSNLKKWCFQNNIEFKKEWLKENGFKDMQKIPEDIIKRWKSWVKKIIDQSVEIKVPLKGKYVMVLGKDKRDQKYLNNLKKYSIKPYPKKESL